MKIHLYVNRQAVSCCNYKIGSIVNNSTDYAKKSAGSTSNAPKSNGDVKPSESKTDAAPKSSEKSPGKKT